MATMHAYEVVSMHVSKACYINMYRCIDEPFWFNASLWHTLVTLVLIANKSSTSYFSLIPFLLSTSHSFLPFKLVFGYGPDIHCHSSFIKSHVKMFYDMLNLALVLILILIGHI